MGFWIGLVLLAIGLKLLFELLAQAVDGHVARREQQRALYQALDEALTGAEHIHNIATFTRAAMYDEARRKSGR